MDEGIKAVRYARRVIDSYVKGEEIPDEDLGKKFREKSGSFVTILTYPDRNLRGCIGIPEPVYDLKKSLAESAKSATQDPRFPPLKEEELSNVIVEVTILTPPKLVEVKNPREYLEKIKVEEFLSQTCIKAGLPPDAWIDEDTKIYSLDEDTKIYSFQGQIFAEKTPYGEIEERKIDREGD